MKSTNVTWHETKIKSYDVEQRNKHLGCIVWLTGLSASGKSTIAIELEKKLFDNGYNTYILDGDNIRHGLNSDLGFSPEDRVENIRRISEVSKLFREAGIIVLTAFISPYKRERDFCRSLVEPGRFIETYIKCSLDVCIDRDPKGLYKKAIDGELKEFTGISAPYEAPKNPEIIVNSGELSISESVDLIYNKLLEYNIIPE